MGFRLKVVFCISVEIIISKIKYCYKVVFTGLPYRLHLQIVTVRYCIKMIDNTWVYKSCGNVLQKD